MSGQTAKRKRRTVRVTAPDTACGDVGHMSVDQLVAVAADSDFEINCPRCGQIHLTPEEAIEAEQERIVDTMEYKETVLQAEAQPEPAQPASDCGCSS